MHVLSGNSLRCRVYRRDKLISVLLWVRIRGGRLDDTAIPRKFLRTIRSPCPILTHPPF